MGKVNRDHLDRARALLVLVLDLKMSELGAESLVAETYQHPGEWRRFGNIKVRKEVLEERFSVRG